MSSLINSCHKLLQRVGREGVTWQNQIWRRTWHGKVCVPRLQ